MPKKKGFVWVAAAILCLLLLTVLQEQKTQIVKKLGYTEFAEAVEQGEIRKIYYSDGPFWQAETAEGESISVPNPRNDEMKERLLLEGIDVVEKAERDMLPVFIFAGLMVLLFAMRKKDGVEKMAVTEEGKTCATKTFADVIVSPETLNAMGDITCYLKDPKAFQKMGARPPRGVLLYGPPGTGKTLLAQALAGETGKPFYAVSGSDFVQVYVGVGASRIRSLFRKARKAGGGVIFIDEIDALGKKRDNANDEREQTLNALLTEMNGFSGEEGIIVLAATNRPETLDQALTREGRFDRRIEIGLPDREDRRRMLGVHTKNKPLAADVDLDALARETAMLTGAQLESLVNEAAIRSLREGAEQIHKRHLEQAFIAQLAGEERRKTMRPEEKHIIAVHEAGHALATHHLLPGQTISRVTIIPTSKGAAGYSLSIQKEQLLYTKKELLHHLAVLLAGRAAEETVFGTDNVTNGAGNDLEKAEELAKQMVAWKMAEEESEQAGINSILRVGKCLAMELMQKEREKLDRLSETLMEKETLQGTEIMNLLA